MNGCTNQDDMVEIYYILTAAFKPVVNAINAGRSFSVAYIGDTAKIEDIDYYLKLNPRKWQTPKLAKVLEEHLLKKVP